MATKAYADFEPAIAVQPGGLDVVEDEAAQRRLPAMRTFGRDAGDAVRHVGDKAVVIQGRLEADVGGRQQAVGDQEGVRFDLLVGGRKGVYPAPQLDQAAGFRPAGELTAEVGGVHRPGEEHGGVEDRRRVRAGG